MVVKLQADDGSDGDNIEQFAHLSDANGVVAEANWEVDIVIMPPDTVDGMSDEECVDEDDLLPSTLPLDAPGLVAASLDTDGDKSRATPTNTEVKSRKKLNNLGKVCENVMCAQTISTTELNKMTDTYLELVGMPRCHRVSRFVSITMTA